MFLEIFEVRVRYHRLGFNVVTVLADDYSGVSFWVLCMN